MRHLYFKYTVNASGLGILGSPRVFEPPAPKTSLVLPGYHNRFQANKKSNGKYRSADCVHSTLAQYVELHYLYSCARPLCVVRAML